MMIVRCVSMLLERIKQHWFFVTLALVTTTFPLVPALSASVLIVGVNRVHLGWETTDAADSILGDIQRSGTKAVRLSLSDPVNQSVKTVIDAAVVHRLKILLEIPLGNPEFYPGNVVMRSGNGRTWAMPRLSTIDIGLYRTRLASVLAALDEADVSLLAIEVGNEINWAGYNGDLAVHAKTTDPAQTDLNKMANGKAIQDGLIKYVEILRVTRQVLSQTHLSKNAKIISAGLADASQEVATKLGLDIIPSGEFIRLIDQLGAGRIVDAYGIHVYPSKDLTPVQRFDRLSVAMTPCFAKACWITEWGVASRDDGCSTMDRERLRLVEELRNDFRQFHDQGKLKAIFYFDWDGKTPYHIWACNKLSPSGLAALQP